MAKPRKKEEFPPHPLDSQLFLPKHTKNQSIVWEVFRLYKPPDGNQMYTTRAWCTKCPRWLSTGRAAENAIDPSNLLKHIRQKHPEIITGDIIVEKAITRGPRGFRLERVAHDMLSMMATEGLPYNFFESDDFQTFFERCKGAEATLPSRDYLDRCLEEVATAVKMQTLRDLRECQGFTLCLHTLPPNHPLSGHVVLNATFIDDGWVMQRRLVDVVQVGEETLHGASAEELLAIVREKQLRPLHVVSEKPLCRLIDPEGRWVCIDSLEHIFDELVEPVVKKIREYSDSHAGQVPESFLERCVDVSAARRNDAGTAGLNEDKGSILTWLTESEGAGDSPLSPLARKTGQLTSLFEYLLQLKQTPSLYVASLRGLDAKLSESKWQAPAPIRDAAALCKEKIAQLLQRCPKMLKYCSALDPRTSDKQKEMEELLLEITGESSQDGKPDFHAPKRMRPMKSEVSRYLDESLEFGTNNNEQLLQWWRDKEHLFPQLAKAAKVYLAINLGQDPDTRETLLPRQPKDEGLEKLLHWYGGQGEGSQETSVQEAP